MEHNVIPLDTAKQLKEAGFRQDTFAVWMQNGYYTKTWVLRAQYERYGETYAAPTAQEIADQLPKNKYLGHGEYTFIGLDHNGSRWGAALDFKAGTGDTLAEALAQLWLELHEGQS